jgi:Flp pilus assembly protein TadG
MLTGRRGGARFAGETRSVMSLEMALVAPLLLTLTLAGVDGARALLIWNQVHNAANAIAEAAEKLSVTVDPVTGVVTSELTADQMQQAMSIVYAEIPQLNLGNGGGLFPGQYAVSLSSIGYTPSCTAAAGCGAQTAYVQWSSALSVGGRMLYAGAIRPCGTAITQVTRFPDTILNWTEMASPVAAGGVAMTLAPQVVADVRYSFTPYFPFFIQPVEFVASSTMPAPIGGLGQSIALNTNAATGNVTSCG